MLESLKEEVLEANLMLPRYDLVSFTWGNVSGICRENNLIVIKPSGVKYENMSVQDMVVIDLEGNVIEGNLKPSSDTPTHLILYKFFPDIGGVVHTHSTWATIWAQAGKWIPCFGTTHADYFQGDIPCTRKLTKEEVADEYEKNTGLVIKETLENNNYKNMPAVLVNGHAPFNWGKDVNEAVHNAVVLEEIARMAYYTQSLNQEISPIEDFLLNKHYLRKHGSNAYYGQKG